MACRKVVCQECATEWEGINYCAACLAERRRVSQASSPAVAWVGVALAVGLLFFLSLRLMVWAGVFVMGLL